MVEVVEKVQVVTSVQEDLQLMHHQEAHQLECHLSSL